MSDPESSSVTNTSEVTGAKENNDILSKKNGAATAVISLDDDDDIFKSAIESPVTESDRAGHPAGEEIDLNDDDDAEAHSGLGSGDGSKLTSATMEISLEDSVEVSPPSAGNNSFKNGDLTMSDNEEEKSTSSAKSNGDQTNIFSKPSSYQNQGAGTANTNPAASNSQPQSDTLHKPVDTGVKSTVIEATKTVGSSDGEASAKETVDGQYLEITVTEPQKQGDGISGFIVYRVTTKTNIALFRRKEFAVWRRFSDFLGLHSKLAEKYLKKGRIVPPAPEKNIVGTTKVKMGGSGEPGSPSEFLEKRRAVLERFMNRTAAHSILRVDPDFRDFLEIDSDLPKSTSTSALSGAGFVRLVSRVGETVNKMAYKMDESDPWFEEKIQNIDALETQLRKVHGSVELLVTNRKELAHSTGTFAKSAAILSHAEEHTSLARALAQLADVEEKVEQLHNEQANSDFYLFCELLKDYITLIGSVKEVFHERVKSYQLWQHSQQTLNKKREVKARLELQVRNDKLPQAREEVVEWEGKVERAQEEFNNISAVIKKEMEQFEINRVKEFKKIIIKYLESLLKHQQELVQYWETFLPEAKAIS